MLAVVGWRCAVCGATRDVGEPFPWRCPNAIGADRRHVLRIVRTGPVRASTEPHPFAGNDHELAWAAYAEANGMTLSARRALVGELDDAVAAVAGTGFHPTPFTRSAALSDRLGFSATGGVWVKDETGGVAGSQKARHLFSILLHLRAAEILGHLRGGRPPLAIASCGNAALAAATLARAADWPIDVYVPTWMSDAFGDRLDQLGATIHRCARRAADPPGDPAMLRFREAVAAGAIPFTVQGPENALCLDGGRTIGWEIADRLDGVTIDRAFVQVGGGAFATCLGDGLLGRGRAVALHPVQAEGCAPFARAWGRVVEVGGLDGAASRWADVMTPWAEPSSSADGILDDETYDWLGVAEVMASTGGAPVVAPEPAIVAAHELATAVGFTVSPTGSAGLAGLLEDRDRVGDDERVLVVMSGVAR
jgi:threonine dehydratase